jgi:serine/threonine protein kinase
MILLILLEFIGGNFVAKALQYLHKERTVHRDGKATNILVGYILVVCRIYATGEF